MNRSLRLLIGLGCGLRLYHFARDPSVWHDEAALIVNVLRYNFRDLLGPLLWNEAAPPLFLWLERAAVLLLGDTTFALRLLPALASCLSLAAFGKAAQRSLPPRGAFCAVLLIAASDRLLWHACEAKPYSLDVLLASLALFGHAQLSHWPLARRLAVLVVVSPFAIFLSYPACFLCGGLWLALLPEVRRAGRRDQALFVAWSIAFVAAFLALYFGPARAQRTGPMEGCWAEHFPNWSRPLSVPAWALFNSGEVLRYNFMPLGFLFVGLLAVGIVSLLKQDRGSLFALLIGPPVLALVAAIVGGYPFGGSRLEVFAAPGLALLIGAGVEPVRESVAWRGYRWGHLLTLLLVLTPAGWTAYRLVHPWPRADAAGAARFIIDHRRPGDAIAANHWEYAYYFRRQPGGVFLDQGLPTERRVWVAFTAPDRYLRRSAEQYYARHGRILERHEFSWTFVLLLDRSECEVVQR